MEKPTEDHQGLIKDFIIRYSSFLFSLLDIIFTHNHLLISFILTFGLVPLCPGWHVLNYIQCSLPCWCLFLLLSHMSVGARAGASEGAEEAGGERQAAPGVCTACQRFPPVAAGNQVEDMFFQLSLFVICTPDLFDSNYCTTAAPAKM